MATCTREIRPELNRMPRPTGKSARVTRGNWTLKIAQPSDSSGWRTIPARAVFSSLWICHAPVHFHPPGGRHLPHASADVPGPHDPHRLALQQRTAELCLGPVPPAKQAVGQADLAGQSQEQGEGELRDWLC